MPAFWLVRHSTLDTGIEVDPIPLYRLCIATLIVHNTMIWYNREHHIVNRMKRQSEHVRREQESWAVLSRYRLMIQGRHVRREQESWAVLSRYRLMIQGRHVRREQESWAVLSRYRLMIQGRHVRREQESWAVLSRYRLMSGESRKAEQYYLDIGWWYKVNMSGERTYILYWTNLSKMKEEGSWASVH